ncbi:MAG: hypothetical protein QOF80_459 [Verrucomicrobiota bacterium]
MHAENSGHMRRHMLDLGENLGLDPVDQANPNCFLLYLVTPNLGALCAAVRNCDKQFIPLRIEESGTGSPRCGNFRASSVMICVVLFDDVDETFTANRIEASPFRVVENFIGVAGDIEGRYNCSRVCIKNDKFRGIATGDEKPAIGFVQRDREVCGCSVCFPSRVDFAFGAIDHGHVLCAWHVRKDSPSVFLQRKGFRMRRQFDCARPLAVGRVDDRYSTVPEADKNLLRHAIVTHVVGVILQINGADELPRFRIVNLALTAFVVRHEKPILQGKIRQALRCAEAAKGVNTLTLSQIEYFHAVVAQRADEQSFAGRIEIEVVDPAFDAGEGNRLFQFQDSVIWRGGDPVARCRNHDPENEMSPAVQESRLFKRSAGNCRGYSRQSGHEERAFDSVSEVLGRASPPVMEEKDARIFVRHVGMDCDDVNPRLAQGL